MLDQLEKDELKNDIDAREVKANRLLKMLQLKRAKEINKQRVEFKKKLELVKAQ